jgi:hypothetical protein
LSPTYESVWREHHPLEEEELMAGANLKKAQAGLDARDAEKRRMALKDPNADTFAATARGAKAKGDRPWVHGTQDATSGGNAATGGAPLTKRTIS